MNSEETMARVAKSGQKRFAAFGERLAHAMRASNLKPADLSGHLRVSTQMVGKYLRGESLPGRARVQHLAEILGVPVESLVRVEDEFDSRKRRTPAAYSLITAAPENTDSGESEDVLRQGKSHARDEGDNDPGFRSRQEVVDWVFETIYAICKELRPELEVPEHPRVRGTFFRYAPAVLVMKVDDMNKICNLLAVAVKDGAAEAISECIGEAYNWMLASDGAPFFLVWVVPDALAEPKITEITALAQAMKARGEGLPALITDYFIVSLAKPWPELRRFRDSMPAVVRSLK